VVELFDDSRPSRYAQAQLIPRIGIDVGGRRLRARTGVELSVAATRRESMTGAPMSTSSAALGLTLGVSVGYGF